MPDVSLRRQCQLLGINRSSAYYQSRGMRAEDLSLMRLIDEDPLRAPVYGSRRLPAHLSRLGHTVNRKRVQQLMHHTGLHAVYPKPCTSQPDVGHRVCPYLTY